MASHAPLFDVRSPKEFLRGAVPGAVNLPLLSDEERHAVGLCYKQIGRVAATQLGLELFAAKAERVLAQVEACTGEQKVIGVHCWRGGLRSQLTAAWLKAAGFAPVLLIGGYKAYRREVEKTFAALEQHEFIVLDGRTGSGKTDLVRYMRRYVPTLDLEGMACHRGSAFGDFAQEEVVPSQQTFENRLAEALWSLELADKPRRILVEIESKLGPLSLPKLLRAKIYQSPVVLLERDFADRVARLADEYSRGWGAREDKLFGERLELLKRYLSGADLAEIIQATQRRDFLTAASILLERRYDKVYDRGIARRSRQVIARFNLTHEFANAVQFLTKLSASQSGKDVDAFPAEQPF